MYTFYVEMTNFPHPTPLLFAPREVSSPCKDGGVGMGQDFFPRTSEGTRMSLGFFNPTLLCFISVKDLVCISKYLNALILRLLFYCV